ncbi:MAG: chromate transporter [Pseudobdellovibrionaceae bacterium]
MDVESKKPQVTLRDMVLYFLKLGSFVFGGPVVLCERMRRDLVEDKKWITPEEYNEGFSLSQMAPGPLAAQLAIYLGWARGKTLWATIVGIAFVAPSFFMVLILATLYVKYEGLNWLQGAFYGVGAAVIAIIALSSYKLSTKSFKKDRLLWIVSIISAAITIWTESENVFLFLLSGVALAFLRGNWKIGGRSFKLSLLIPSWLMTGIHGPGNSAVLWEVFRYFAKAGAFVFGSGLAIVPFLHSGVVMEHSWLTERQFLDAVAIAMVTPGPVVITVAFIGYLVSGPLGGFVGALGVFLPCYLFVVIPAPYYNRISKIPAVKAFVDGVTAAAIGAIAGATFILGKRAIIDIPTIVFFIVSLLILIKFKKFPEPVIILIAGIAGIIVHA